MSPNTDEILEYRNAVQSIHYQADRRLSERKEKKLCDYVDIMDKKYPTICLMIGGV